MNVYHLTEFVIGELPENNNYINFAIFTCIGAFFITLLMTITCFLRFYLIFLFFRFYWNKVRITFIKRNITMNHITILFYSHFLTAKNILRKNPTSF